MSKAKKVNDLSNEEAAYIAGIIDGEGTVTLSRKSQKENRRLAITISNTEFELLDWILKKVGAGIIVNKKSKDKRWSEAFTYQIYNRQAYDLLNRTCGHLRTHKRKRSELALKKYLEVTPRNGKYTPELLKRRSDFVEEFFKIKGGIRRKLTF